MQIQKNLLRQYMTLSNQPTLKEISVETGIQVSRVFRIFNGAEMKISEFMAFQKLVKIKNGMDSKLIELVEESSEVLPASILSGIENKIRRQIDLWKYTKNQTYPIYRETAQFI
ncbi:MAG: hypothetical protein H6622_16350 [Halobacteriovoraceae bacterium]|nr:hypothetical protein [Halobacteriovoraceae bacterium]